MDETGSIPMQITIFGASGKVGQLVTRRALEGGHRVQAFVHTRDPFTPSDRLTVLRGDVADTEAVSEALAGSQRVISTLGSWGPGPSDVLTIGMRSIIPAMQQLSIARLVSLTGAGGRWRGDTGGLRLRTNRMALSVMARSALRDGETHLDLLAASDLDWTCVRAPTIRSTGESQYRLSATVPSLLGSIPAPAVAHCLLDLVEQSTFSRQAPGIHRR
jgi:putative NADH-flavin reductase